MVSHFIKPRGGGERVFQEKLSGMFSLVGKTSNVPGVDKMWEQGALLPGKDNKAVLEPRVSPAFGITYFCAKTHCNIRLDPIPKLEPKVIDP